MSDFLDRLPSREQEKIRKRLRSPEAYAALRERVKGPEDLEREMDRSENLAELQFALETTPDLQERLRSHVADAVEKGGADAVLEKDAPLSDAARAALEQGKVAVTVSSHPSTHQDALVLVPEGNVREKLPVNPAFSDQIIAQFAKKIDA